MLPALPRLVGLVVAAFDAQRTDLDDVACILKDATSRRGFAGKHATRRWCCRLSAFAAALRGERLLVFDVPIEPLIVPLVGAVLLTRWEAVRRNTRLSSRVHLRTFGLELAVRVATVLGALAPASLGSDVLADDPAWIYVERRAEPLVRMFDGRSLAAIARSAKVKPHSVGRWATGEIPLPASLDRLVTALVSREQRARTYAELRWHYALARLVDACASATDRRIAQDLAGVLVRTTTCQAPRAAMFDREKIVAAAVLGPVPLTEMVEHARQHGASDEWVADVARAMAERRSLPEEDPEQWLACLQRALPRPHVRRSGAARGSDDA